MKADNQWHDAVLVAVSDTELRLFNILDEWDGISSSRFSDPVSFVRANYNKGQPAINYQGYRFSLVDYTDTDCGAVFTLQCVGDLPEGYKEEDVIEL